MNKPRFRMGDKVVSLLDTRPFFDLGEILGWNPHRDEYWVKYKNEQLWIPGVALTNV